MTVDDVPELILEADQSGLGFGLIGPCRVRLDLCIEAARQSRVR